MNEELVISIGGSVLLPQENVVEYQERLSELVSDVSDDFELYLVVGGGRIARKYIEWGRELGGDEATLDELGIGTSRLNAKLLIISLGNEAYPLPAQDFDEAISAGNHYQIVTMGGTHPGHTTDAVAAMLAEKLNADRLINATSVDGVYSADPKEDEGAERYDNLSYDELIEIVKKGETGAGPNVVFDPLAAEIIKRASIETRIVDGTELEQLEKAVRGSSFHGTTIQARGE